MFLSFASVDQYQSSLSRNLYDDAVASLTHLGWMPPNEIHGGGRDVISKVGHAAMVMQQRFDELDYFWRADAGPCALLLMWPPYDLTRLSAVSTYCDLRGDEIIFSTMAMDSTISYAIGHPRAMINWAITLSHSKSIPDPWPTAHRVSPSDTAKMVWWAQRINLRVYEAR